MDATGTSKSGTLKANAKELDSHPAGIHPEPLAAKNCSICFPVECQGLYSCSHQLLLKG